MNTRAKRQLTNRKFVERENGMHKYMVDGWIRALLCTHI